MLKRHQILWMGPLTAVALALASVTSVADAGNIHPKPSPKAAQQGLGFSLVNIALQTEPLQKAAQEGDLPQIEKLLAQGGDPDTRDATGQTPLITAALAGQEKAVENLLAHGADAKARNNRGLTALHAASLIGDVEIIRLLIDHGLPVNDQDNKFKTSPLIMAVEENKLEAVKLLLASGAKAEVVEINGNSATSQAGWREYWDVLKLLKQAGATCQPEEIAGPALFKKCSEL